MAYRVEFPPDLEKHSEVSIGLSLPKITGKSGKDGKYNQPIDATEGRIVAVLIDSPIVGPVWFALDDSWKSGDEIPLFYASEIPQLQKMCGEELRKRYTQKLALGGGWIRDRTEDPVKH